MKDWTPGLELGARFVLIRRLGRGGMADVFLARDHTVLSETRVRTLSMVGVLM